MGELLGADTDALDRVAESLTADALRVLDIRTLAQRAVAELQTGWSGPDLTRLTQSWEQGASPLLTAVSASMDTCAARLRAQSSAQRQASSGGQGDAGGGSHLPAGLAASATGIFRQPGPGASPPASPPKHGSPGDNATWWRALSPREQRQVITEHPDWIGNRDGVAFAARDQANRALLTVARGRLVAEGSRLEAVPASSSSGGAITNAAAALDRVRDKLASLDAIEATLSKTGERQLLLLDLWPERAQAAIARGNVDTADNVAVFVPGVSATVSNGMSEYDTTTAELQRLAELESQRANANLSAAAVTWIGYQAPQMGRDLLGDSSAASEHAARRGAAQLVPFLQGIGAARTHDAHLTLLGHSYGSTTAGLALRQSTGVDDVVFFGSPGFGTSHLRDLLLPAGHLYYIEARQDLVGDLGRFGIDPSHLAGIEHASAKESTVMDPLTGQIRHFKEVTGHSSYLSDDSTSQYNISVVAAGVPDRRVHDSGQGIGDVLSWPIPGTYR